MKKAFLTMFIVMVTAVLLFGQNNTAQLSQSGDGNQAEVTQQGDSHSSLISQDTWGTGHYAKVTQDGGDGNSSDILQNERGAAATVTQHGTQNVSGLKQSGPNTADINQQGDGNVLGSYTDYSGRAFQKNGTSFPDDRNALDLDQLGDMNKAGVWQEHHAQATVEQDGDENETIVYQSGTPAGGWNKVTIAQIGTHNLTDARQDGESNVLTHEVFGYDNDVNATQEGFDNNAIIDQRSWKDVDNYGNDVTMYQHNNSAGLGSRAYLKLKGDNNEFQISQSGSWNQIVGTKGMFPDVTAENAAGSPGAFFKHEGDGSAVEFTQDGNQNLISGEVYNGYGDLDIMQQGNMNEAFLEIGGPSTVLSGNAVDVGQIGNDNVINVLQGSSYNSAVMTQTGNDNDITIDQR